MLSVVDGAEQLESFFGQHLPQVAVAGLIPIAIFAFIAFWDLPVAGVLLFFALLALIAPEARWSALQSTRPTFRIATAPCR